MLYNAFNRRGAWIINGKVILRASAVNKAREAPIDNLKQKPHSINKKDFRMLIDAPKKTVQVLVDIFPTWTSPYRVHGIFNKPPLWFWFVQVGKMWSLFHPDQLAGMGEVATAYLVYINPW